MKARIVMFCMVAALAMMVSQALVAGEDKCAMCHTQSSDTLGPGHQKCAACHVGAEEHMDDPMDKAPAEVTDEKCQACHQPTEEFKADAHHNMGMPCGACHTIHDD